MDRDYIMQVAEFVADGHTIKETADKFGKKERTIQLYLAKVRNPESEYYNKILKERIELSQAKIALEGHKTGGKTGKRGKSYEDFTARMYADAYIQSGFSLQELADLSKIPKSTLFDMIRGIDDKELQDRIDNSIQFKEVGIIDKVQKEQWKR